MSFIKRKFQMHIKFKGITYAHTQTQGITKLQVYKIEPTKKAVYE